MHEQVLVRLKIGSRAGRKVAERVKKITSGIFEKLFREHPEPVWVVRESDFAFLDASDLALDQFLISRKDLNSRGLADILEPEDLSRVKQAIHRGEYASLDLRGVRSPARNGNPLHLDLLVRETTLVDEAALIVVTANASPRKVLEEQLRQAQKMESVGMLAGGIAHDFNNLLTIISGYSHMVLSSLNEEHRDHRNRSAVEQVIKASDRAAELTSQLLAFSRRQVHQVKVIELNEVMKGMTTMLRRLIGEHIDLRIHPGRDLGRVHSDAGQIEQVIMNLVVNARDAMPSGGKLFIETSNTDLSASYRGEHMEARPGPYVMLAVTDSGTGMDAKTRAKIFEPFFTTKEKGHGTGLGLATVYGIAKRSGGTIDVYSEVGRGTTVKVYFPRVEEAVTQMPSQVACAAPCGHETILLVEDEEAVRNMVRAALEMQGYHMLVAENGAAALRLAKEHKAEIDLLITDLIMPGMGGRDVARKIRRMRPETSVLYISGYTDTALQHSGALQRSMSFLGKPFTPEALSRKVREVLEAQEPEAGERHQVVR